MAIKRQKNGFFFVKGLPIKNKLKITIVSSLIFALFLNTVLPVLFKTLSYEFSDVVSIVLAILTILFSLGSVGAEGIVIGILILMIFSNWWDFRVQDLSLLRTQLMKWTIIALIVELVLGKISFLNLFNILRRSLGGGKR